MRFIDKFKEFIARGNVIDLAVAVIIGGAFQGIVNSLVTDILTPPLGFVMGRVKFTDLAFKLVPPGGGDAVTVNYGKFLQAGFNFLIIAFCVFLLVELVHRLHPQPKPEPPPAPPEPSREEKLLAEIRDLLKARTPGA